MWKEIFVDDDIGLQKCIELFFGMKYSIVVENLDLEMDIITLFKRILNTKKDCHCYYFNDGVDEMNVIYKYDDEYDKICIFQYNTKNAWVEQPMLELFELIENRHSKNIYSKDYSLFELR